MFLDTGKMNECSGCFACADACPKNAIEKIELSDKAYYPRINMEICIECGRCRKVCPNNVDFEKTEFDAKAYAFVLQDKNQRLRSASGGAFEKIANCIYDTEKELYIAGAIWKDEYSVCHKLLKYEQRGAFYKSKYVQSDCQGIYKDVEIKLKENKAVLFTGTPCQIAALKSYLGKDYSRLYTVDLICHGVPGANLLKKYLFELEQNTGAKVSGVEFRKKKHDLWGEVHSHNIQIELQNGKKIIESKKVNHYLIGFGKNYLFRESCYACKFACVNRNSDLTIGDFWNIQKIYPKCVDYTGVSAVLVNSNKGMSVVNSMNGQECFETDVQYLYKNNGQLVNHASKPTRYNEFWSEIDNMQFNDLIELMVEKPQKMNDFVSGFLPGIIKRSVKRLINR